MVKVGDFIKGNLDFKGYKPKNHHYGLVVHKELTDNGYDLYVVPMSKHNKPHDKAVPVYSQYVTGNIDFSHERNSDPYIKGPLGQNIPHYSRLKLEHINTVSVQYHVGSDILQCNSKGQPIVYGKYHNKSVLEKFANFFEKTLNKNVI